MTDQTAPAAALRDRIAEALMRWAEGNNNPNYAQIRRPETVTTNAYSRADAVLTAIQPEIDRLRAQAQWQVDRKMEIAGEWLNDRTDKVVAEKAIARVRDLHVRNEHTGTCEHCSERDYPDYAVPWPCPTIRVLDGASEGMGNASYPREEEK